VKYLNMNNFHVGIASHEKFRKEKDNATPRSARVKHDAARFAHSFLNLTRLKTTFPYTTKPTSIDRTGVYLVLRM